MNDAYDSELDLRVKAALIRGESPKRITRGLQREGIPQDVVIALFTDNDALVQSRNAHDRKRNFARIIGAAIFVPSLALNIYYLFFWDAGWLVSGLFWAITLYGLLVMFVGEFGTFWSVGSYDRNRS